MQEGRPFQVEWDARCKSMRVVDPHGQQVSNLVEWRSRIFDATSKEKDWKKGRSAHSLAEFIMNRKGAAYLETRISAVLSQSIELERATPEYLAKFDSYPGNPSNLDLGITGHVERLSLRSSLFVGVEAKVDETFGNTVMGRYSSALKTREAGKRTNAPERVKGLLSKYFSVQGSPDSSRFADIRYQLLTGTAGTVAAPGEVSVFYILVFRTSMYDERKGLSNLRDYESFIGAACGRLLIREGKDFRADELELEGKRLVCVYNYVDL